MQQAVFGVFADKAHAIRVAEALRLSGFANKHVSVLFAAGPDTHEYATKPPSGSRTDAEPGAAGLGWLIGLRIITVSGIGSLVAAGPVVAVLAGSPATAGGIVAALSRMGVPTFEAKRYADHIKAGKILISVHTDSAEQRDKTRGILVFGGAEDVAYTSAANQVEGVPGH
jgi:hypothetical protein